MSNFEWLLAPIDVDEFFSEYWETKPLYIQRSEPGYFESVLSATTFDKIIQFGRPDHPYIIVTKNQSEVLPSDYINSDRSLNLNQIYKKFDEGNTIILNSINQYWHPLGEFAESLTSFLNHKVVPNAYFSPANSTALKPHYDTHDVFVLQCQGSKHWNIYPQPQIAPMVGSFQPIFEKESLGEPLLSVELQAGDMLYIPRGFVHEAKTNKLSSLHMTVGVYPTQWVDLYHTLLDVVSIRNPAMRKALPPRFIDNYNEIREQLGKGFSEISADIQQHANIDELIEVLDSQLISKATPVADGHFDQLVNLPSVGPQTRLIKRKHMRCKVHHAPDGVRFQFPGNTIKGPRPYLEAFEFVSQQSEEFSVSDIPGIPDEHKLKLAIRLIRGGVLRAVVKGK